jgi:hypothetical protein
MEGVLGLVFREQGYLLVQTQRTVVVAFAAEEGGEVAQRIQDDWTVAGQCAWEGEQDSFKQRLSSVVHGQDVT